MAAVAVLLSAITLAVSYSLPTITFARLGKARETYSIWGGIESLWEDGNWILAPVVFLFSMVFPVGKLLALGWLLTERSHSAARKKGLEWLHLLGKWSMLDVFIVGVFVAAAQLEFLSGGESTGQHLAKADSRWGIHVFTLAIVMSMLSVWLVARREGAIRRPVSHGSLRTPLGRLLATARAASLIAIFALPLLQVSLLIEKWFVKFESSNEVHLWRTNARLAREGELLLAVALGLFVIGIPILRTLCALRLRWLPGEAPLALRLARGLDAWSMVDVFGLGLLIVQVKLAELTATTLLAGFWVTIAAAMIAMAESWELRRACRRGEG